MCKVSIISPTYNHEQYIAAAIESVIGQTFADWEMLIINDGSTDRTLQIAMEYAEKDDRIKVFDQENVGIFKLSETYNFALAKASGEYIALLECDDLWEKDKLSIQVNYLDNNPDCIMSWGKAAVVEADGNSVIYYSPDLSAREFYPFYDNNPAGSVLNALYINNCIPALTILIRKTALQRIDGFQQPFHLPLVDYPTWIQLATIGTFHFEPQQLGRWRNFSSQVTKHFASNIFENIYKLTIDHYKRLPASVLQQVKVTEKEIGNAYLAKKLVTYARSGRYKLLYKQYEDARRDYLRAIFSRGSFQFMWRLRALTGYLLSFFHLDVEWVARLLNKRTYS
jgi:glycosyltransferase involved in cell wall biosynthesis